MRDHFALLRYLEQRAEIPFAWGSDANDCVSFAAGAVRAQTGRDWLAGLAWSSEADADALIERIGLQSAIDARLRPIAPASAHRGDVAGVMRGNRLGLMIVEGATLVGPGPLRAMRLRRGAMVLAWSVD